MKVWSLLLGVIDHLLIVFVDCWEGIGKIGGNSLGEIQLICIVSVAVR